MLPPSEACIRVVLSTHVSRCRWQIYKSQPTNISGLYADGFDRPSEMPTAIQRQFDLAFGDAAPNFQRVNYTMLPIATNFTRPRRQDYRSKLCDIRRAPPTARPPQPAPSTRDMPTAPARGPR